jgi:hypothetical protein
MDKEQARFVLRSFRPDGADASDVDFEDALKLATEDRELGEWLADERHLDSEFSKALVSIEVPQGLKERILSGMAENSNGLPQAETEQDAALIGALASIHPPASLRSEILAAMQRTACAKASKTSFWRKAAVPLAAAAGIAMAFYFTSQPLVPAVPISTVSVVNPPNTVPVDVVQASFIRTFESPLFSIDERSAKHGQLMEVLEKKKLPCPKCLPPGLVGVKGVGCRELVIDGKRGSLVCFDEPNNGTVHLVIFKREDVCGDLPTRSHPALSQNGPWAVARWVDEGHVFVLLGSRPVEKLAPLFDQP